MYLDGAASITVVTDHATLVHLLKQSSSDLTKRQAHYVEKLMPYTGTMKITYRKGSANEADPVSRRPDFYSLWWDGELPNDAKVWNTEATLLAMNADEISVDDEFGVKLRRAYESMTYFDENGRWHKDGLQKTADGMFLYHGRIVIPRPVNDPRPALELRQSLMHELHDAAGRECWQVCLSASGGKVSLQTARTTAVGVWFAIEQSHIEEDRHLFILYQFLSIRGKWLGWIL